MKQYIFPSIRLTIILIIICGFLYPFLISAIGKMAPGHGKGETITVNGRVVGYEKIGQKFTGDRYFTGRPSIVDYNAAASGGSNMGPSNPDYLKKVNDRIDSFLVHNPGISKNKIPAEMVTASGSGLDPDISPASAEIQVERISRARKIDAQKISFLIHQHTVKPLLGFLGPKKINVLKLNIALDSLK
ncbi:MAG: K(+)-transporting ATPase subunit C [Flavitalea sp.]